MRKGSGEAAKSLQVKSAGMAVGEREVARGHLWVNIVIMNGWGRDELRPAVGRG